MSTIRLNPECIDCLLKRHLRSYPDNADTEEKIEYMQRVLKILADAPNHYSAPKLFDSINEVKTRMFDYKEDFGEIKRHFNALMLRTEEWLDEELKKSSDPLKRALCYAMMGNYIDFGTRSKVDEAELNRLLKNVNTEIVEEKIYEELKADLLKAKTLVYLTDNCGEIVMDKLVIKVIRRLYPEIDITAVVRGADVLNDSTMSDAEQVGLTELVTVIDNGSKIAGTWFEDVSDETKRLIKEADIIISKGQGNFETLNQCGKNIYYIFMCKCKLFADRFDIPLLTGMMINDKEVCRLLSENS